VAKRRYEEKLQGLNALRAEDAGAQAYLSKALRDPNNYVVARAASIVSEFRAEALIPELVEACERFYVSPDPQCLAKVALARALRHLGYHDADFYLRGLRHVQLEPAWGGRGDSAGGLRGICALAITECPLDPLRILSYLTDALADPDKLVRIDVARAIAQMARDEGALPLRLRVLVGDEPDVIGECCAALLSITPGDAVPFVARLLECASPDVQLEAAAALAQSREPTISGLLRDYFERPHPGELRKALLLVLRASPLRIERWVQDAIRADEGEVRLR